jgi:hypothetical protein
LQSGASRAVVVYVVPPRKPELAGIVAASCTDHAHEVVVADEPAEVQRALARRAQLPDAVCLVGSADLIPHVPFDDDTGHDDAVLTDNDWGRVSAVEDSSRDTDGLPHVPVTRIPTSDPAVARRLLAVRDSLPSRWDSGVAVSARNWQRASAAVLEQIAPHGGVRLDTSPAQDDEGLRKALDTTVGRLYFNVHGSDQVTYWLGDDGEGSNPAILRPASVSRVAQDAILVSEACYGARHDRTDTVALRFLAAGGSAFVGSTIIAWGPPAPPNALADLVPAYVYRSLDAGRALGEAVLDARRAILAAAQASGWVTPQVVNTVSSFVAYGSPLARVRGVAPRATPFVEGLTAGQGSRERERADGAATGSNGLGDVLGRVRAGTVGSTGPLGDVRRRNEAAERRLGWRCVATEMLAPGALASRFRTASQIEADLAVLLGPVVARGTHMRLATYHTAQGAEAIVYAQARVGAVRHTAAVRLDVTGGVVERLCTRGGRADGRKV